MKKIITFNLCAIFISSIILEFIGASVGDWIGLVIAGLMFLNGAYTFVKLWALFGDGKGETSSKYTPPYSSANFYTSTTNPSTGLPMVGGCDAAGNAYGCGNSISPISTGSSFDRY